MAALSYLSFRKVLYVYLILFLSAASILLSAAAVSSSKNELQRKQILGGSIRRMLLDTENDEDLQQQKPKKKSSSNSSSSSSGSSKNQTKLIKAANYSNSKNQTKLTKTNNLSSTKNQTKPIKTTTLSSGNSTTNLKKLNSTSSKVQKPSKSLDPIKLSSSSKNKTITKPTSPTKSQALVDKKLSGLKKTTKKPTKPVSLLDQIDTEDDDLVSEFRDLPVKFQQTLLPDLERISTTSKAYINKYNKEITKGFKPIVGHKYAATIASIVSSAFILIPLILVSLIFNHFKAYFSLQKILIFIQAYLSIYFSILCLSSLVTGLEPLKFFYATSQSTYVCLQVMQTLGYIFYLLLLLMYLILVFSTECGLGSRMLGLGQTFVGYAVGVHYYVAVFHRVVLHQPPKTNWKVHGIYATCFLVICLFARAERRKKAYLEEGGEEGKKS
ncbi:hypothetical protein WN944_023682 [Citrus x changshan-huyou]|uniref:Uncharacterized protein n=1 Tax=Citrus x changshan-huyou TaxID=2935761 RepID=A0AAP0N0L5_9ROSI